MTPLTTRRDLFKLLGLPAVAALGAFGATACDARGRPYICQRHVNEDVE